MNIFLEQDNFNVCLSVHYILQQKLENLLEMSKTLSRGYPFNISPQQKIINVY